MGLKKISIWILNYLTILTFLAIMRTKVTIATYKIRIARRKLAIGRKKVKL